MWTHRLEDQRKRTCKVAAQYATYFLTSRTLSREPNLKSIKEILHLPLQTLDTRLTGLFRVIMLAAARKDRDGPSLKMFGPG